MIPLELVNIDFERWTRAPWKAEKEMFQHLIDSIKERGVMSPIMVEPNYTLIDGVYRVEATRAAGLTEIPAIVRDDLTLVHNGHYLMNLGLAVNVNVTRGK